MLMAIFFLTDLEIQEYSRVAEKGKKRISIQLATV